MRTTQGASAIAERVQPDVSVDFRQVTELVPYARNTRKHPQGQVAAVQGSIAEFGWTVPVLADADGIVAGHCRVLAAERIYAKGGIIRLPNGDEIPLGTVPVLDCTGWPEAKRRAYIIADNKLAQLGEWDEELLRVELEGLQTDSFDLAKLGFDDDELQSIMEDQAAIGRGTLRERFLAVPLSVLSARDGWWRDRKRAWLKLGLRSEVGRGKVLESLGSARRRQTGKKAEDWSQTSIFDPVLCELAYRWFCPPGGLVLDPFAGGSVRGVVAARLGRGYYGVDLRPEQVEANRDQAATICAGDPMQPAWVAGDSLDVLDAPATPDADFVFSCPPYADLERYSDDARDLSNMSYDGFLTAYRAIIAKACAKLKPDRFACFVVGDIRDPDGAYRDFVGETVQAFRDAGLSLYNEAVLVTVVGTLAVRAGKQFAASRKLGKSHQNVLVFIKGDPRKATEACGVVEVAEVEADAEEEPPASALAA